MKVYTKEIKVRTHERFELIDITDPVEEAVRESGVRNGIALVFATHATAAVIANEHEQGLIEDIKNKVAEFTEPGSSKWRHNMIDDNAHAHIGSALFGQERIFPVVNGRLVRGVWQNIFLLEMDGPRHERRVIVTVLGE
ncbi:secondary thiamine-phosphate synthase enzyme YjbQ [Thermogladius sp. 4427co]|uniref:secondary thiamine-phosphate synthase enzyme YjbQ n=1 Tax=Thermogladius sp. 4427co TaxID=3450718 RepID=UPI003F798343